MNYTFLEILTFFIVYSFLGWVMESIFRSMCEKKIINTGFLRGPFCPIYGIGSIIMITLLSRFEDAPVVLFLISFIILTLWEYIVGVMLEKLFKTKYWDYSDHKFNYKGRICLTNSLAWGVLGVLFTKYIHPFVENLVGRVDTNIQIFVVVILLLAILIDAITSIVKVKNIRAALNKAEDLNKEIKEKLKELKNMAKEVGEGTTKTSENIQNLVEELKKRRNRIMVKLYKNATRLKKAFPAINTKEFTEILNKKIEIKKKKK